jgi:hypothetical protein
MSIGSSSLFSGWLLASVDAPRLPCFSLYPSAVPSGLLWPMQRLLGTADFLWGGGIFHTYYMDIHILFPYQDICLIFQVG